MAATTVPLTGAGATVAGLGYTGFVTSLKVGTTSVDQLEWSTLGTTEYKELKPGDLRNPPEVTAKVFFVGGAPPVGTTGTAMMTKPVGTIYAGESLTITFPTLTGGTAGVTLVGTAFVKSFDAPECKHGELMEATMTFQYDGVTGPAWTAP